MKYVQIATALYRALHHDPFYLTLERSVLDSAAARESIIHYLEYSMLEAEQSGELVTHFSPAIGASVWCKPQSAEKTKELKREKLKFISESMGMSSQRAYSDIVGYMSSQAKKVIDDSSWYLSVLGLEPGHQGRGFGADLVSPVLAKTDELGVPTYLETFTPRNEAFYERLGYLKAASFYEPTVGSNYALMVRPAPSAS